MVETLWASSAIKKKANIIKQAQRSVCLENALQVKILAVSAKLPQHSTKQQSKQHSRKIPADKSSANSAKTDDNTNKNRMILSSPNSLSSHDWEFCLGVKSQDNLDLPFIR